jgi:hypothetical protein
MKDEFNRLADKMPQLLKDLESGSMRSQKNLSNVPEKGVYVFYDLNKKPMYIGRANRCLKNRIQQYHYKKKAGWFRKKHCHAIYKRQGVTPPEKTEKDDPVFIDALKEISDMKVRVVKIENQKEQALFELYAQIELDSEYNDFNTQ